MDDCVTLTFTPQASLTLHAGNHDQVFSEVGLWFTWHVAQRHEHLSGADLDWRT